MSEVTLKSYTQQVITVDCPCKTMFFIGMGGEDEMFFQEYYPEEYKTYNKIMKTKKCPDSMRCDEPVKWSGCPL